LSKKPLNERGALGGKWGGSSKSRSKSNLQKNRRYRGAIHPSQKTKRQRGGQRLRESVRDLGRTSMYLKEIEKEKTSYGRLVYQGDWYEKFGLRT